VRPLLPCRLEAVPRPARHGCVVRND
jgi:hypothetical protein